MKKKVVTFEIGWGWFALLGACLLLAGFAAIYMPLITAVAIDVIIGGLLVIGGAANILFVLGHKDKQAFILKIACALVPLAVGAILVFYPLKGALLITALIAAYLAVEGILKTIAALYIKPDVNWGWLISSGIISILLSMFIWVNLPFNGMWILGILVGINLIFTGCYLVMTAVLHR
ncbi:MAG: DUF308 domain-containing protein [Candidatus Omnitrophica bacterium]|nr:DUF308 domain-containing protein [Candidatus Omnitrophota bacterium]MDD5488598.1 DUF308 domain-containing protein [Candidatus Omnitrophota bacterium]